MNYTVNNATIQYNASGKKGVGDDVVLLKSAIDLTGKTNWSHTGYTIETLFEADTYATFRANTHLLLIDLWQKSGLNIPENFSLDQYHITASDKAKHLNAVEQTKIISTAHFPVSIKMIEDKISSLLNEHLIVKNPYDSQSVFHFRVIRPMQNDNNPLHRDVWLEDYKDCINLYIPITGSDENSSLVIIPGSHLWPESKIERTLTGANIEGVNYNVPAVTDITEQSTFIRPNPKENEVLIFSPYLIHGGAVNLNTNTTRISIELRLWRK